MLRFRSCTTQTTTAKNTVKGQPHRISQKKNKNGTTATKYLHWDQKRGCAFKLIRIVGTLLKLLGLFRPRSTFWSIDWNGAITQKFKSNKKELTATSNDPSWNVFDARLFSSIHFSVGPFDKTVKWNGFKYSFTLIKTLLKLLKWDYGCFAHIPQVHNGICYHLVEFMIGIQKNETHLFYYG